MPRIQILSDLHLESPKGYNVFEVPHLAPYLALIGDIGEVKDAEYFTFIEKQLPNFEIVFVLFGNHEPYSSDWTTAKHKMKQFETDMAVKAVNGSLGKLVFLDQTRCDLSPEVTILGCTLHSKILPEQMDHVSFGLNDFYYIADWTVEHHNQAHTADLAWLNQQVIAISPEEPSRKIMILTHHSPTTSPRASDPKHGQSNISSGFASDLSDETCWTNSAVKLWAFGHTHFNTDYSENGKRVVANQRGYFFSQADGFDAEKCIEL
ncbi:hypothetical protein ONS95_011906 [Cadophora gregata]|uniref:uncharacterized protein n=1 Tax=Cadophora gregata TaxID=51156 RepID=UPI0026DC9213|nr:uncharacterized protein ONS95_011906 [Cadophora gregata]KAK0117570.1 hypothetical protein ONS95_011906 [Cadophora gregata]